MENQDQYSDISSRTCLRRAATSHYRATQYQILAKNNQENKVKNFLELTKPLTEINARWRNKSARVYRPFGSLKSIFSPTFQQLSANLLPIPTPSTRPTASSFYERKYRLPDLSAPKASRTGSWYRIPIPIPNCDDLVS